MKYPSRVNYTETDKALMWDRCQKCESFSDSGSLTEYDQHVVCREYLLECRLAKMSSSSTDGTDR